MIGRIIFSSIGIIIGAILVIKSRRIVQRIIGPLGFAEKYLGGGGTYVFFQAVGFIMIIVSLLIMVGIGQFVYDSIIQTVVGGLRGGGGDI